MVSRGVGVAKVCAIYNCKWSQNGHELKNTIPDGPSQQNQFQREKPLKQHDAGLANTRWNNLIRISRPPRSTTPASLRVFVALCDHLLLFDYKSLIGQKKLTTIRQSLRIFGESGQILDKLKIVWTNVGQTLGIFQGFIWVNFLRNLHRKIRPNRD